MYTHSFHPVTRRNKETGTRNYIVELSSPTHVDSLNQSLRQSRRSPCNYYLLRLFSSKRTETKGDIHFPLYLERQNGLLLVGLFKDVELHFRNCSSSREEVRSDHSKGPPLIGRRVVTVLEQMSVHSRSPCFYAPTSEQRKSDRR